MDIYSQPYEQANAEMRDIESQIKKALSKDLDGNHVETQFRVMMPTLENMQKNEYMSQMMQAVNALLLIDMVMLSTLVIYSLMLSDVNEQTYQFAMMRALGF